MADITNVAPGAHPPPAPTYNSTGNLWGSGSPEGVVVGQLGNTYVDIVSQNFYEKASGNNLNTGWIVLSGSGAVQRVFGGTANPNGSLSITGPAYYIQDDGAGNIVFLWSKPNGVSGNTGWV